MCHIVYGIIKVSLLLFFRRIFITPWFRKTTSVFMGVVIAWMIAATFVGLTVLQQFEIRLTIPYRDTLSPLHLSTNGGPLHPASKQPLIMRYF